MTKLRKIIDIYENPINKSKACAAFLVVIMALVAVFLVFDSHRYAPDYSVNVTYLDDGMPYHSWKRTRYENGVSFFEIEEEADPKILYMVEGFDGKQYQTPVVGKTGDIKRLPLDKLDYMFLTHREFFKVKR